MIGTLLGLSIYIFTFYYYLLKPYLLAKENAKNKGRALFISKWR